MIAVILEATPRENQYQDYVSAAATLRPQLEHITGFVSVERFESLTTPGKFLSLLFWENEASLSAWRNDEAHRVIHVAGRRRIFADYRLRVATVHRDYGMTQRTEAPVDSQRAHSSSETAM